MNINDFTLLIFRTSRETSLGNVHDMNIMTCMNVINAIITVEARNNAAYVSKIRNTTKIENKANLVIFHDFFHSYRS